jgi:chorismate--pyruvate lyase
VATFDFNSSVGQLARNLQLTMTDKLWGRRSIFMLYNKPLMVSEVFLPGAFSYQTIESLVTNPRVDHV